MSQKYLGSEKQQLLNGIGTELCWGWSPSIDLTAFVPPTFLEESVTDVGAKGDRKDVDWMGFLDDSSEDDDVPASASKAHQGNEEDQDVNFLLCGASDIRHILHTLSQQRVRSESAGGSLKTLHFYIYEPNLRVHARHLMFLQWLFDSVFSFAELEDRVAVFLEAFGNSMVREITAAHIKNETTRALKAIADQDGPLAPSLDFSDIKLKERDFVEEQMRAWISDSKSEAKIEDNWRQRLRTEMAERYDNRDNIIDWDFNFSLMDHTNAMRYQEYRLWRNCGIAYDYCHINPRKGVNYDYTKPNKTLCHFARPRGGVQQGSYFGDVKNGPFYAFGVSTGNTTLHARNIEGLVKYGNGVISMHNVRAMLYQLLSGKAWPWADHAIAWDDPAAYNYLPPGTLAAQEHSACLPKVKFHFVGLDLERFLFNFADKGKRMAAAFVGSNCTQFMTREFFGILRPDAVVVAETIKFVLDSSDEAKEAFVQKIIEFCAEGGWSHDPRGTANLHTGVPAMSKREGLQTEGQQRTSKRYAMPYQLVFRKRQ